MKTFKDFINEASEEENIKKIEDVLKNKGYKIPQQVSVKYFDLKHNRRDSYFIYIYDPKIVWDDIDKIANSPAFRGISVWAHTDEEAMKKEEKRLRPLTSKYIDKAMENIGQDIELKNGWSFGLFDTVNKSIADDLKQGLLGPTDVIGGINRYFYEKYKGRTLHYPEPLYCDKIWKILARAGY